MYLTNITDYDNMTDDYNNNNCTNNDNSTIEIKNTSICNHTLRNVTDMFDITHGIYFNQTFNRKKIKYSLLNKWRKFYIHLILLGVL